MTTQPVLSITEPAAASTPGLTPAAAWSRRVRRVGGFTQTAFAAFWLTRAGLAVGGRAGDALVAASASGVPAAPKADWYLLVSRMKGWSNW